MKELEKQIVTPPHTNLLWRNDITGLRALAVLPVVLYHAFPNLIPGGYFGVDIFFVISGYLISGIIFKGLINKSFSYKDFYIKRIKRIIPNLTLLLICVLLFGLFYSTAEEYRLLGKQVYSSGLFIQNFRLLKDVGYFTSVALHQPLLHLWSLAIEEQFYIIFPIICTLLFKRFHSIKILSITTIAIVIGSLVFCFSSGLGRDFNFYFPLTRFWEIGFGIILALAEKVYAWNFYNIHKNTRHVLSLIGFSMIFIPMVNADATTVHPGVVTLLPVFGAVFLIASYPDALINRYLLCLRPMTFIGLISYSLYLWHWPFLAFLFICYPEATSEWKAIMLILSVMVSSLIYLGVETPVRRSIKIGGIKTEALCLGILVIVIFVGVGVRKFDGFPERNFGYAVYAKDFHRSGDWSFYEDAPSITYDEWKIRTQTPNQFPTVIFVGDSHAEQYYLRAQKLGEISNKSVGFITNGGCFISSPQKNGYQEDRCRRASRSFYNLLKDSRVKTLVIVQKWGGYSKESIYMGIQKMATTLRDRPDMRIFILLDNPWSEEDAHFSENFNPLYHSNRINPEESEFMMHLNDNLKWKTANKHIETLTKDWANIIDATSYICPDNVCNLKEWYRDSDHLQPKTLEEKAVWLDPIYQQ